MAQARPIAVRAPQQRTAGIAGSARPRQQRARAGVITTSASNSIKQPQSQSLQSLAALRAAKPDRATHIHTHTHTLKPHAPPAAKQSSAAPAFWSAFSMHMPTPRPSARGSVMWCASQVTAPPRYSQIMFAPRFCACSSDSITSTPAPSPMTKPSRPLSQGRDAPVMLALLLDSALRARGCRVCHCR